MKNHTPALESVVLLILALFLAIGLFALLTYITQRDLREKERQEKREYLERFIRGAGPNSKIWIDPDILEGNYDLLIGFQFDDIEKCWRN